MGIVDKDDVRQTFRLGFLEAKTKELSDKRAYTSAWTRAKAYKRSAAAYYMRKQCDDCGATYSWFFPYCRKCGSHAFSGIGYKSGIGFDLKDTKAFEMLDKIEYEQFCTLLSTDEQLILERLLEGYTQVQIANMLQIAERTIQYRFAKMKCKYKDFVKN